MDVKTISASVSVRVNTGNYEGTEFRLEASAELDELDDEATCAVRLQVMLRDAMVTQLMRSYAARGKRVDEEIVKRQHGLG